MAIKKDSEKDRRRTGVGQEAETPLPSAPRANTVITMEALAEEDSILMFFC